MRKKATMAAIAAAEAAALTEQAKRAAEAARVGAKRQLAESGVLRGQQIGSREALGGELERIPYIPQVICDLCLFGEAIGSKKAERMVPCPACKRCYHRSCLKHWAANRDLFSWASWVCGFCRICEVCRRTGEPNKLMFCKRCDAAYHAYCQQPQLKHTPKGPFLCPKHVYCHSCGARVPGSGASSRWFLGYTTCDSCGRLFMRGKYCSICLKVYRDSEASPMVCCDSCEHWVHCRCDGISDEKYREYQLDNNLQYHCAACRRDCHQVKDLDDAIDELWRRRDDSERDLISQYQVSAGLSFREKSLGLCPSSDEDEDDHLSIHAADYAKKMTKKQPLKGNKNERKLSNKLPSSKKGRDKMDNSGTGEKINKFIITLPKLDRDISKDLSGKGFTAEKKGFPEQKEASKKIQKLHKKEDRTVKLVEQGDEMLQSMDETSSDERNNAKPSPGRHTHFRSKSIVMVDSYLSGSTQANNDKKSVKDQEDEGHGNMLLKTVKFLNNTKNIKDAKIVLHVPFPDKGNTGKVNMKVPVVEMIEDESLKDFRGGYKSDDDAETDAEGSEEFEPTSLNERDALLDHQAIDMNMHQQKSGGISPTHSWEFHSENVSQPRSKYCNKDTSIWEPSKVGKDSHATSGRGYNLMAPKVNAPHMFTEPNGNVVSGKDYTGTGVLTRELHTDRLENIINTTSIMSHDDGSLVTAKKILKTDLEGRQGEEGVQVMRGSKDSSPKVSLKLKLKKPVGDVNFHLCGSDRANKTQQDDGNAIRGQRSKRKRRNLLDAEMLMGQDQEGNQDNDGKYSDDSWILQNLGRDAIRKRVKVFCPRDKSWYKGTVSEVLPQKSQFSVTSDDGRQETIEFGKRSVHLFSHSKKHAKP